MQKLGLEQQAVANAAGRARSVGWPDAANRLADQVEELGYSRIGWNVETRAFEDACAIESVNRVIGHIHFISYVGLRTSGISEVVQNSGYMTTGADGPHPEVVAGQ